MATVQLKNIIWKEGKHYVAQCLNIDVSSFGKTRKEALANLHEALELALEGKKSPKVLKVQNPEIMTGRFRYA